MNVNVIKEFKMGSLIFFKEYNDFNSKDVDILAITDLPLFGKPMMNMKLNEKDVFFMGLENKNILIEKTLDSNVPMRVGKFLVPEFCEYIEFEISDYDKLSDMFDNLDEKHRYEIIIRDAYIENNGFFLTDEQRLKAYEEYKRERPDRYSQT